MKRSPMPKINPELQKFLPEAGGDLIARLLGKIEAEGAIDPIKVAEDGDIVDGYTRFEIYKRNKTKKFPVVVILGLDSLAKKKMWMINNQLARRNLRPQDWSMLAGLKFEEEKAHRQLGGSEEAAKKVAEELGSSQRSVERAGEYKAAIDSLPPQIQSAALSVPVSTTLAAVKTNAPLFCPKCTRTNMPQRGCPKCAELQAEVKKKKKTGGTKPPKKGSELVDWKGLDAALGVVVRLSDRIVAAYPDEKKVAERGEYDRLTAVLVRKAQAWKKKLTGGGK